jgi:predicted metal-dependent hydrolase
VRIADNQAPAPQLPLWSEPAGQPQICVRHSQRARRVAVRITSAGRVELVVPRGVSERQARAFLDSRAEWVSFHVARRRAAQAPAEEFPPRQIVIDLLGESWRVFQAGGAGRPRLVVGAGVLELRGVGSAEQWRVILRRWLARRAAAPLETMLRAAAATHGFAFASMHIRNQRTRWGSCSTRGAISLNLALLFQPVAVVRYLLCHELAHTRHMNHSARFWRCVEACEPDYRALDAQLCSGWRRVPGWVREQK